MKNSKQQQYLKGKHIQKTYLEMYSLCIVFIETIHI
nr:MAG TPA: hypothetical protein [Caudoviricetes sp.]